MSRPTACVVGSGGREHALALALARSADVVVTPGNPGIAAGAAGAGAPGGAAARLRVTSAPATEVDADLTVIGPEAPLVAGLADRLRAAGRAVVGPGAQGARLEGSKAFMKELLSAAGVPTARWGAFGRVDEAVAFLRSLPGPWVVKTDGLAAGKGVLVAATRSEAEADVAAKLSGAWGPAGRTVVVEEGLVGPECSLHVLCDGTEVVPMVAARDYKRLSDADRGPNTGGMGAYAPLDEVGPALVDEVLERAVVPVVAELRRRGIDYRGVLYAGLMLTDEGPKVLEYNVRFGDPETQVVTALAGDGLYDVLAAVAAGRLRGALPGGRLDPEAGAAVCVVMAAAGYPVDPRAGDPIAGLGPDGQLVHPVDGVTVHHAGTRRDLPGGPFLTGGGRVLGLTATGTDVAEARRRAYRGAAGVSWPGAHYRRDVCAPAFPSGAEVSR